MCLWTFQFQVMWSQSLASLKNNRKQILKQIIYHKQIQDFNLMQQQPQLFHSILTFLSISSTGLKSTELRSSWGKMFFRGKFSLNLQALDLVIFSSKLRVGCPRILKNRHAFTFNDMWTCKYCRTILDNAWRGYCEGL